MANKASTMRTKDVQNIASFGYHKTCRFSETITVLKGCSSSFQSKLCSLYTHPHPPGRLGFQPNLHSDHPLEQCRLFSVYLRLGCYNATNLVYNSSFPLNHFVPAFNGNGLIFVAGPCRESVSLIDATECVGAFDVY